MMRLLLIEDDDRIRLSMAMALEDEGYEVASFPTAELGLKGFEARTHEMVLVDLMLPGISGFDCIREFRKHSDVPIVVVSAREDTHDIVAALEAGADDYVVKPIAVKELTARIRALRRRVAPHDGSPRSQDFGDLTIDPAAGEVRLEGREVGLTSTEFRLICELAEHTGQVLSRAQLLTRVWGHEFGDERVVDVHIGRLRRKVEKDPADPRHVLTLRGLGYKLR
jgi:two-component system response regulator RegX3